MYALCKHIWSPPPLSMQVLLQLAHGLFEEQTCLDHMVQCIMMETQELVPCDKCYVLLRDMDSKLEVCYTCVCVGVSGVCVRMKEIVTRVGVGQQRST